MTSGIPQQAYTAEERLRALLDNLSAYIETFHGGSVKLGGACQGCPLSPVTLHGWVEGTIKQFFPDLQVESVSE
jgi:Fe-S cluster biogenesis protein NfuA